MARPRTPPITLEELTTRPGQLFASAPGPNLQATYDLVIEWWNKGHLVGAAGKSHARNFLTVAAALDEAFSTGALPMVDKLSRNWREIFDALAPVVIDTSAADAMAFYGTPVRVAG